MIIRLVLYPRFIAIALITTLLVSLKLMVIEPLHICDLSLGSLPSVVYLIVAPDTSLKILMFMLLSCKAAGKQKRFGSGTKVGNPSSGFENLMHENNSNAVNRQSILNPYFMTLLQ